MLTNSYGRILQTQYKLTMNKGARRGTK
uniref:Uncharacterized protein n=1 Tax=Triticum urartu TaxID=4572 RepID=A0A8R7QJL7_TRIUA